MTAADEGEPTGQHRDAVRALFEGLRAVGFDFDGVLVDSVGVKTDAFLDLYPEESDEFRAEVVRHHLEHGGISRYEKIRVYERLRTGIDPHQSDVDRLAADFARSVKDRVISAPEMPGASRLLDHLTGRLPLFVCSGTPEDELREIVSARGWRDHFDEVLGSPTTKTAMLLSIADRLGCSTQEILLIGDSSTDVDAARQSGSRFLLMAPIREASSGDAFAHVTIPDPETVLRLLRRSGSPTLGG